MKSVTQVGSRSISRAQGEDTCSNLISTKNSDRELPYGSHRRTQRRPHAQPGRHLRSLHGLAMEYSKQGDLDRALAEFSILLKKSPDYTPGYFMAAQTLARADRIVDAKTMLSDGIASARRTGNLHAQSEMEAMLAELG